MAKEFIIDLSVSKKKLDLQGDSDDEKITTVRELELYILKVIFRVAINHQKKLSNSLECKDCVEQIENLKSTAKYIKFSKGDLDCWESAFEILCGNRPKSWMDECSGLFRQISERKEFKE